MLRKKKNECAIKGFVRSQQKIRFAVRQPSYCTPIVSFDVSGERNAALSAGSIIPLVAANDGGRENGIRLLRLRSVRSKRSYALLRRIVSVRPHPIVVGGERIIAVETVPIIEVHEFEELELEVGISDAPRENGSVQVVVVDFDIERGVVGVDQVEHSASHRPVEVVVLIAIRAISIEVHLFTPTAACSLVVAVKAYVGIIGIEVYPFARARMPCFVEHTEIAFPLAGNDIGALTIGVVVIVIVFDVDVAGVERNHTDGQKKKTKAEQAYFFHGRMFFCVFANVGEKGICSKCTGLKNKEILEIFTYFEDFMGGNIQIVH